MHNLMSWCDLPILILSKILDELDVVDRLCFSVVCKYWNFAYNDHKELRPSIPLLLLPTHGKGNGPRRIFPCKRVPKSFKRDMDKDSDKMRHLYDVTTRDFLRVKLEVPYGKRFCGSCFNGWLGTIDEVQGSSDELVINLINPYQKHYSPIELPPLKCLYCLYYEYTITKLILTSDPALHPHDFTVVVCFSASTSTLAIFNATRNCWTYIDYPSPPLYTDAIVHMGSVYVVGKFYDMVSFSLNDSNWPPKINQVAPRTLDMTTETSTKKSYLVETSKGEMLLIKRFRDPEENGYLTKTINFKVFKLIFDGETKALLNEVEVNNLEGDTLFLGVNYSTAISASKISEVLKPNSIYFTDDYFDPVPMPRVGHRDIGVFCLEDQSIIQHYKFNPESDRFLPPSIWSLLPF